MVSNTKNRPVVLISCVKSKRDIACKAKEMYTSTLFKKMMSYALSLEPKEIFILSAQYGLLALGDEISPYEKTLKTMGAQERRTWSKGVLAALCGQCNLREDQFIILAGKPYREFLTPELSHFHVPMEGLAFGEQLQWLGEQCNV